MRRLHDIAPLVLKLFLDYFSPSRHVAKRGLVGGAINHVHLEPQTTDAQKPPINREPRQSEMWLFARFSPKSTRLLQFDKPSRYAAQYSN